MSTKVYLERHLSLPSITKPDTIYLLGRPNSVLQLAYTNASNTMVYRTLTDVDVNNQIDSILTQPGGAYEQINDLQAKAHVHANMSILNGITISPDNNLTYNGVELSPLLIIQEW